MPPVALLSVHDKTGLAEFGKGLAELGVTLIASGGTAKALTAAGLSVMSVEELTKQPEMLGGRVKTLHPAVHGGILARATDADFSELAHYGMTPIDLVVCNLYPFQQTIATPGITLSAAIEQIDIGGVTLLRAAAKNFARVSVLCDPADYGAYIEAFKADPNIPEAKRRAWAVKAFNHTRTYDTAIHAYLSAPEPTPLPETIQLTLHRIGDTLRYGENPHQSAALYTPEPTQTYLGGTVLGGKQLSYNNILDLDSAWRAVQSFSVPTVVIVKHLNPCGIATGINVAEAFPAALASDPLSAFGGVIAVNEEVTDAFVSALGDLFIEAIVAPGFTESAQHTLNTKRKNCRLVAIPHSAAPTLEYRSVRDGVLVQTFDGGDPLNTEWQVVTKRAPSATEMTALQFAWQVVQHVKSNAIVLSTLNATVGIGGGLSSRVDAAKLAVEKAGDHAKGAVMASDAFFPFADGALVGIKAGVTAIVQPGGSVRDAEVIAAADEANVAMVVTGVRHFRH
jgi:phosphoribosylaminoimidazolecarboxamide formyltransferase/IMP cyclohydrolase